MEIKTKTNKWDLMKHKGFCTAKKTINKTKRQPSEWQKSLSQWFAALCGNQNILGDGEGKEIKIGRAHV